MHSKYIWIALIAFLLSGFCVADNPTTSIEQQKTTVVEGNHFYSNYEINTTYAIDKVNTQRPIILVLRKKDDSQTFDNTITISLISGDQSVQCKFTSFNGMCFLGKLPSSDMKMKLKCDHLPCQASWTIFQPSTKKLQQNQSIQQMYDIQKSDNHMIAMITCNNPQIKDFDQLVTTYSQNQYVRGYTNNIIYLLFKRREAGHLFFKIDPQAKACAQMAIYNVDSQVIADKQMKDFVFSDEASVYKLATKPQGQFRFDFAFHEISKQAIKSSLLLTLTGQKNGNRQTITTSTIKPSYATTNYQFSYGIPAIAAEYSNIQLSAKSDNNIIILNYLLSVKEQVEIQDTQHSHFQLKKGQKLKFQLISEPEADKGERISFFLSKPDENKISTRECSKKDGCSFEVQAIKDTDCILYAGKSAGSDAKGEVNFIDFKGRITKKIKDEQLVYLRTPLKQDEVIRVVVNNPNVIIRAASEQKCKVPDEKCYQHIANSHHHFIYEPKKDGNLLFQVEGLDACVFTVSVISQGNQSIQLKDGEPFSYLMDDSEKKIYFKFSLPEKTGVSFNLIAPLNDLRLIVNNGKQKPNGEQHTPSTDGYISFAKNELDSKQFRILVEKTSDAKKKSVHFTLIASTSGANLRLDPGIAHTESLKPKQSKDFVFEFDKKADYILNFYTPSVNKQDLKIKILVNNEDKWTQSKVQHISITENSDVLNLRDISQSLCISSGDTQCEIFLRIANSMSIEIDITLTLLVKDSVIELKDGLWQTYAINTVAKTSHFYFLPTTKNSSISIMYKSSLVDVGLSYSIWKSDKEDIDPTQWPFPPYKENITEKFSYYRTVNHIMIDTENLKGCWPSCVILLSLYKKKSTYDLNVFQGMDPNNQGNFSLMAANKVFQIPEKSKVEIMLKRSQQKYMMVDLKHALNKQSLTFFINAILGSYSLYANVYSQKNPRCPTVSQFDFTFGELQTQIRLTSIIGKLQENIMTEDKDFYLCILVTAYLDSKFTIQFTSDEEIIKLLHYDSFQSFAVEPKSPKFYQLEANQKYEIKFTREKGYFYVKIAVCKDEEGKDFEECLQQLKSSKDRGKQIITKTEQFAQKPCSKCIVFIRIDSDDYSQGIIHVQSEYSMVELKQKDIISDFTNQEQTNRYAITSVRSEETIISVSVTEGDPIVEVTNYGNLYVKKQKDPKTNNILIVIPPEEDKNSQAPTTLGGVVYDAFQFSNTFRYLVITVKSKNPKLATAYTISFSSGDRQAYLEDGLLISSIIEPNKLAKFLYKNIDQSSHGYLSLSMNRSSALFNLKFKMFTFSDPNDQDTKTEVTPQKPPMRKNTPNPTIVYSLPVSKLVSIQLQSQTEQKVSLMILHQQLVILPFDQEFPFQLHKTQTINLMTDVNNPGYLLVTIRKCDQSSPQFGYTFNYDSFQKSQFQYTTTLADDPKFQFYIKASKIGPLYMQMNVTDDDGLFAVTIHYSDSKIKGEKSKAGKNGVVEYQITDSKMASVTFHSVVCSSGSKCGKDTKYYWMSGSNLQDVYTQTVCPFSFFQVLGIKSSQPLKITQITSKPSSDGTITFSLPLQDHISYLSIKAVSGAQQVYYQPLQIITVWGAVSRAGTTYYWVLIGGGICLLMISLVCYRRTKRITLGGGGSYDKLPEGQEFDY